MKWFTQAIAQQPAIQIKLFPNFVEVADELALGWEEALRELPSVQTQLLPGQVQAINNLDNYMCSISGEANALIWTLEGLTTSKEWQFLRLLADQLLEQMKWPKTKPTDTNYNIVP